VADVRRRHNHVAVPTTTAIRPTRKITPHGVPPSWPSRDVGDEFNAMPALGGAVISVLGDTRGSELDDGEGPMLGEGATAPLGWGGTGVDGGGVAAGGADAAGGAVAVGPAGSEATTWTIAVASRTVPPPSVWEAVIVESPATGVSPTMTSNVPSGATVTPLAATEPSTDTLTGEHGPGQNPEPMTVTRSPGGGWAGVTWISGEAPTATGGPSRATRAIVPAIAARSRRDMSAMAPLYQLRSITSP
jgi:hypothetical protein